MIHRIAAVLCVLILSLSTRSIHSAEPTLRWETNDEGVLVREGKSNVLFFQARTKSLEGIRPRSNYIHPLYGLDGTVLTEDFPDDHLHHRGIFWAWHQMRIGDIAIGDGWAINEFSWDVVKVSPRRNQDGSIAIDSIVEWKSKRWHESRRPVAIENHTILVHPTQRDIRMIDIQVSIQAVEQETVIGGSEDEKGYGGFSLRVQLPKDIQFVSQNGIETPQKTSVAASPWMSMIGSFSADLQSAITVFCHPDSAGYPQRWILRSQRSMQNPVWPGREPRHLSVDKPLRLRYRVLVQRHPLDGETINQLYQDYVHANQTP